MFFMLIIYVLKGKLVFLLKNVMFNSMWYLLLIYSFCICIQRSNIFCNQTNIYSIYILNHKYLSDCKKKSWFFFILYTPTNYNLQFSNQN